MNTLTDTINYMTSENYKERFLAEYHQLRIRYDKLHMMVCNWDQLDFTPTCEKSIYEKQLKAMSDYLFILRERAEIEGINL